MERSLKGRCCVRAIECASRRSSSMRLRNPTCGQKVMNAICATSWPFSRKWPRPFTRGPDQLTPQEQAQFAQAPPVDPESYEAYLKGRYHWNRRVVSGFEKAIGYFQEAIAKDPSYGTAYAGLADCLSGLGVWGFVSPTEGCGKAKRLALKALEIDRGLAEAHASLAWATMWYDYDFLAAEREFERSIELNPRYATAHQWFGMGLGLMGRYEEAYTELKRAISLDPCSSVIHWTLGFVYRRARRYDQAIEQHERALELDPNFCPGTWGGLGSTTSRKACTSQPSPSCKRRCSFRRVLRRSSRCSERRMP